GRTPWRKLCQHHVVDGHAPGHDGAALWRCGGHVDANETLFPSSGRDRQLTTDGVSVVLERLVESRAISDVRINRVRSLWVLPRIEVYLDRAHEGRRRIRELPEDCLDRKSVV